MSAIQDEAIETLKEYSSNTLVSELYDDDEVFASALNHAVGEGFEYPDFAYRNVRQAVAVAVRMQASAKSLEDAMEVASQKGPFTSVMIADMGRNDVDAGRVLGLTGQHIVLGLGRSAKIFEKTAFDRLPAIDDVVEVSVKNGKVSLSDGAADRAQALGR